MGCFYFTFRSKSKITGCAILLFGQINKYIFRAKGGKMMARMTWRQDMVVVNY